MCGGPVCAYCAMGVNPGQDLVCVPCTRSPPPPELSHSWALLGTAGESRADLALSLAAMEEEAQARVEGVVGAEAGVTAAAGDPGKEGPPTPKGTLPEARQVPGPKASPEEVRLWSETTSAEIRSAPIGLEQLQERGRWSSGSVAKSLRRKTLRDPLRQPSPCERWCSCPEWWIR